jgi:hypothetical protein
MPSDRIPLTPDAAKLLDQQLSLFRAKFGREPGPEDPVFFDPDAEEPRPLSSETWHAEDMVRREVQVHHIGVGFKERTKGRVKMVQTRIARLFAVSPKLHKPVQDDRMGYLLEVTGRASDSELAAMAEGISEARGVTFVDIWAFDERGAFTIEYSAGQPVEIRPLG